jgi:4-amino-4-deoxy-L-arabinose transferase-like glycosyltransferase
MWEKIKKQKTLIILILILAVATFFRFWKLDSIPPGVYPDIAMNGNNAIDTLQTGNFKLFYPENNGREGLFMWLIALSFKLFGASVWSLRFVGSFFGVLTVLGIFLLAKQLFKKLLGRNRAELIGLLSSFFLAVSFWHNNFSRIGFRAIMAPFFMVFAFYFLLKCFDSKKILIAIMGGIFFGLGFYTYISYRFAPFVLIIILILQWIISNKEFWQRNFFKLSLSYIAAAFITALPIGIYFLTNIQDFFGRAGGVSVLNSTNPLKELAKSLFLHLGMFNIYGDGNWRHNFAGSPELLWPVGVLFAIGIILSTFMIIRSLIRLCKKREDLKSFIIKLLCFGLPIYWLKIMLAPGFLSLEGIPHSLRTICCVVPACLLAGIGGEFLWHKTRGLFKSNTFLPILYICCFALLFSLFTAELDKYFFQWAVKREVSDASSSNYSSIGNFLNSLPDGIQKYIIVNQGGTPVPYPDGLPVSSQTVMFFEKAKFGKTRAQYILPKELDKIKTEGLQTAIIIPLQYDDSLFSEISKQIPGNLKFKNNVWYYETI